MNILFNAQTFLKNILDKTVKHNVPLKMFVSSIIKSINNIFRWNIMFKDFRHNLPSKTFLKKIIQDKIVKYKVSLKMLIISIIKSINNIFDGISCLKILNIIFHLKLF